MTFAGGIVVSRLPVSGLNDPFVASLSGLRRSWMLSHSDQISTDERTQASRSFSSKGLLR